MSFSDVMKIMVDDHSRFFGSILPGDLFLGGPRDAFPHPQQCMRFAEREFI